LFLYRLVSTFSNRVCPKTDESSTPSLPPWDPRRLSFRCLDAGALARCFVETVSACAAIVAFGGFCLADYLWGKPLPSGSEPLLRSAVTGHVEFPVTSYSDVLTCRILSVGTRYKKDASFFWALLPSMRIVQGPPGGFFLHETEMQRLPGNDGRSHGVAITVRRRGRLRRPSPGWGRVFPWSSAGRITR